MSKINQRYFVKRCDFHCLKRLALVVRHIFCDSVETLMSLLIVKIWFNKNILNFVSKVPPPWMLVDCSLYFIFKIYICGGGKFIDIQGWWKIVIVVKCNATLSEFELWVSHADLIFHFEVSKELVLLFLTYAFAAGAFEDINLIWWINKIKRYLLPIDWLETNHRQLFIV